MDAARVKHGRIEAGREGESLSASPKVALGVSASLAASALFAVIFYLAGTARSSGEVLFAWRILATPVLYAPLLLRRSARDSLGALLTRLRSAWWLTPAFAVLAAAVGFGAWLFMWAPRNGHGLDSSLGFLLLPICLVLASRFVLRSRVSRAQWVVVALAGVAVAVKVLATPQLGWVTIGVCVTFTVYFIGRTYLRLGTLTAFAVESTLAVPVAVFFLLREGGWQAEIGTLVVIGIASVAAMSGYVGASALLPMPVFGLLSYVEPMLLVGVALLLGERMQGADSLVYAILAAALLLLALAGFRDARKIPRRRPRD